MLLETLLVFLFARLKGYRLKGLFKCIPALPVMIVQIIAVVSEFSLFFDVTALMPLAAYLESAAIISFLPAILIYGLYVPAIVSSASIVFGTVLNRIVIAQNGGKMPVFPSLSYITGYVTPELFGTADTLHILGNEQTRLVFLTDFIDFGYCILSVGDLLIHLFYCIMLYQLIKCVCASKANNT